MHHYYVQFFFIKTTYMNTFRKCKFLKTETVITQLHLTLIFFLLLLKLPLSSTVYLLLPSIPVQALLLSLFCCQCLPTSETVQC